MRQFDICALRRRSQGGIVSHVVILQTDLLGDLKTRLVAPLIPREKAAKLPGYNPVVVLHGVEMVAAVDQTAMVHLEALGIVVASAREHEYAFKRALDLVFFGV